MQFNINNKVRVRLTPKGKRVLAEKYKGLRPGYPPKEDAAGWSEWQLWDLMQTFGECIFLGCDMPFEGTIEIDEPINADKLRVIEYLKSNGPDWFGSIHQSLGNILPVDLEAILQSPEFVKDERGWSLRAS